MDLPLSLIVTKAPPESSAIRETTMILRVWIRWEVFLMTAKDAALTAAAAVALVTGAIFGATQMSAAVAKQPESTSSHRCSLPLSIATMGQVSTIDMTSPTVGWALSERGIYWTADGGKRFVEVLAGNVTMMQGQTLLMNSAGGYVDLPRGSGSARVQTSFLYHIQAGGDTLSRSVAPFATQSLVQLSFVNSHDGWAMVAPGGAAGPFEPVSLYRTTDAGAHWRLIVSTPTSTPTSHGLPQSALKSGIAFQTNTIGWMTANTWGNNIWLYGTTNGGASWTNHSIAAIPKPFLKDLGGNQIPGNPVFFTRSNGVLPVTLYNGQGLYLYRTTNGGTTWTLTRPITHHGPAAVDILDARNIWAVSGKHLYVTSNEGRTWRIVTDTLPGSVQVDFVTPRIGFALGHQDALWRTENGGRTWRRVVTPSTGC